MEHPKPLLKFGTAFVGFTENDLKKTILDVDGSCIYLPKRTNEKPATRHCIAKSVCIQIAHNLDPTWTSGSGYHTVCSSSGALDSLMEQGKD